MTNESINITVSDLDEQAKIEAIEISAEDSGKVAFYAYKQ